jgi:hypothetical protein
MEVVLVAQNPGSVYQCGEYDLLLGWVVMGAVIQVEVGVCSFTVHSMVQGAIGSPVNIDIQEEKVAVSFRLHGELNALVDTVQVVKEVPQPVGAMWPDDESVAHVTKPAERLMWSPVERHLLEVFNVEVDDDRRHGHAVNIFVELASEAEVLGRQDMVEECQDVLLKMST